MLFDSSDDDLPDIPMVTDPSPAPGRGSYAAPSREDQMRRLQDLEDQFRLLREEMSGGGAGSAPQRHSTNHTDTTQTVEGEEIVPGPALVSRRRSRRELSGSTERLAEDEGRIQEEVPAATASAPAGSPEPDPTPSAAPQPASSPGGDDAAPSAPRDDEVQYELRRLVPHLTPGFTCTYHDAVILIGAIRNGGSAAARGQESLMDRVTAVEAERRSLDNRLAKKTEECDALRLELEHTRQKMRAVQQQSQQSTALLSQKREEMRKQLLIEESRTEKVQVRNKKLERENEDLKSRLRAQMR